MDNYPVGDVRNETKTAGAPARSSPAVKPVAVRTPGTKPTNRLVDSDSSDQVPPVILQIFLTAFPRSLNHSYTSSQPSTVITYSLDTGYATSPPILLSIVFPIDSKKRYYLTFFHSFSKYRLPQSLFYKHYRP